jgi:PPOX class probable F420-dependent enzyme
MRTGLGPDDLPELMTGTDIGVLATRRPDDSIMLSPVWWEWRDGGFNVWVDAETDRKIQHIRRDPRVTFVVPNQVWPYQGYEIRGEATISGDDFYGVLRRTAERFDGPEAAERMVSTYAPGLVIRLEPGVSRGWAYEDD